MSEGEAEREPAAEILSAAQRSRRILRALCRRERGGAERESAPLLRNVHGKLCCSAYGPVIGTEQNNRDDVIARRQLLKSEPGIGSYYRRVGIQPVLQNRRDNTVFRRGRRSMEPDILDFHFHCGNTLS
jgi:hypothetical protein